MGLAKLSIPCKNPWHTDTVKGDVPKTVSVCHEFEGMEYRLGAGGILTLDLAQRAEVRILQPQPWKLARFWGKKVGREQTYNLYSMAENLSAYFT